MHSLPCTGMRERGEISRGGAAHEFAAGHETSFIYDYTVRRCSVIRNRAYRVGWVKTRGRFPMQSVPHLWWIKVTGDANDASTQVKNCHQPIGC